MLSKSEQSEPLRYERKFSITDYAHAEIKQILKFHPACFSEIFYERNINNIYFDTMGMNYYYDNVEGSSDRLKVRIRWYGELLGSIQKPVLEYKIKKGLLGKKDSYNLQPFVLDKDFDKSQIVKALDSTMIPQQVKNELVSLYPILLNRYSRHYFLSADKKFRITIDRNLTYYRIGYQGNTFLNKACDYTSTVLELKYDSTDEIEAKAVADKLPFALTKNSKYLQGLERVLL
jgi:hypothetical protein